MDSWRTPEPPDDDNRHHQRHDGDDSGRKGHQRSFLCRRQAHQLAIFVGMVRRGHLAAVPLPLGAHRANFRIVGGEGEVAVLANYERGLLGGPAAHEFLRSGVGAAEHCDEQRADGWDPGAYRGSDIS